MICQNCQATVDNDLVFCTSCGTRLNETWNQAPTDLMKESIVTETSISPVKKAGGSKLKWIALIIALIALPVSLLVAYRLYDNAKQNQTTAVNQTKTNSPTPTANRQTSTNANQVNSVNAVNPAANANNSNTNVNSNAKTNVAENPDETWLNEKAPADKRTAIWSEERIGIDPESHFAVSFTVNGNDKIIGDIKTLQGTAVEGFVYMQSEFDEHFPDPTFKMFSFGGEKNTKIEQTLVPEKYVLVFMNNTKTPLLISGKVFTVKQ